jgi:hypothetical protein
MPRREGWGRSISGSELCCSSITAVAGHNQQLGMLLSAAAQTSRRRCAYADDDMF